jgi:DNA-binding response OmpR family regulator
MTPTPQTILLGDDDPAFCQVMELLLAAAGFDVLTAPDGHSLVRLAQEHLPDLVLIDLMMPQLDGYEALRQLRNDTRTAHLPLIVLSARGAAADLVSGFESGADDFVIKPPTGDELLARIRGYLRRAARVPVHSPLTGLAGNTLLLEEIRYRLSRARPFALLHFDLSGFKVFNDCYGFARGDHAILAVAELLRALAEQVGSPESFVGHIGGDDFALISPQEQAEPLAREAVARFAATIPSLYDPADLARGYLMGLDRDGEPRSFPLMGLVVGGVCCTPGRFEAPDDVGRAAAAMRQRAKERGPSGYMIDRGDAALPGLGRPSPV